MQDAIANALYDFLRCGFSHDAMFRNRIYFSTERKEALTITWPKKDQEFDPAGKLESAFINPNRFCKAVRQHFTQYIGTLRAGTDLPLKSNFLAAIQLKWELGKPGPFVGMTEEQFFGGE